MVGITCWDGVGCIGGNKILLEDGSTKIWLDFGSNFGRMGQFYEEFVKPKTCLGLYEPVQMSLLPPLNDLYRKDLVSKLANPWEGIDSLSIGDMHGILLSHAHLDHIGALHYIKEDLPIYTSAVTLAMCKVAQDTGSVATDQYCYTESYEPVETGELKSPHHSKNPSKARPFVFVDESPSVEFSEFWNSTPSSLTPRGRQHIKRDISVASSCNGLRLKRFPVDHSVYGASAWAIGTSQGWVVYTGDIRCHGSQAELSLRFAEEAAKLKPIALIIEGTRIDSEETCTEEEVRQRSLEEIKKAKGLVVADFGPRNVERLASFLKIAKETNRKLIILPKDAYLLEKMALAGAKVPSLDDRDILIYCKYEASKKNWGRTIRENYRNQLATPWHLAKNQDKAICCFSFLDVNELAYIKPVSNSMWLFSSCEAFNEEMAIDYKRLGEWVEMYEMAFPGDPRIKEEKSPFHVSGHACKKDLKKLVEIISPKTLIPVHTIKPSLYKKVVGDICEVKVPKVGVPINL